MSAIPGSAATPEADSSVPLDILADAIVKTWVCQAQISWRRQMERPLFNDVLDTFSLQCYDMTHMVKAHIQNQRENAHVWVIHWITPIPPPPTVNGFITSGMWYTGDYTAPPSHTRWGSYTVFKQVDWNYTLNLTGLDSAVAKSSAIGLVGTGIIKGPVGRYKVTIPSSLSLNKLHIYIQYIFKYIKYIHTYIYTLTKSLASALVSTGFAVLKSERVFGGPVGS